MAAQWAAYYGEPETALEYLRAVGAGVSLELWRPLMRDVRRLPAFKDFVTEIGLVDYWRVPGWPDFCQATGDGGFSCA